MDALTSLPDICMSTSIVADQLGFHSAIKYIECHGWTFCHKGGEASIQYRKLEQVIAKLAPTKQATELAINFNAMIDHLYELVDSEGIKDIYTYKPSIRFLEKKSFVAKIHQQTQEFQVAVILTVSFFMDHVSSHHGDIMFWVKMLFRQCRVQKDFTMFCNNVLILFDDDGDAGLAKELLGPDYLDCIRDEVSCWASGLQQRNKYEARLEERIGSLQRGTSCSVMPSPSRNLLFA